MRDILYCVTNSIFATLFILVIFTYPSQALTFGSGTYGTCTYDTCGITIATSGTVPVSIQPTSAGVVTVASDTITVETGASTGYTLYLESASASTALSGPGSIATSSGTVASPQALAMNTWGYRIDSVGGFGAGPTSAVTNAASTNLTFAGLTAQGSPVTLVTTNSAAPTPGDTIKVWYGARANTSIPSGIYSRTVTYTAVTN